MMPTQNIAMRTARLLLRDIIVIVNIANAVNFVVGGGECEKYYVVGLVSVPVPKLRNRRWLQ